MTGSRPGQKLGLAGDESKIQLGACMGWARIPRGVGLAAAWVCSESFVDLTRKVAWSTLISHSRSNIIIDISMPGQRFWLSKVFRAVGTRFYRGSSRGLQDYLDKAKPKKRNPLAFIQGGIQKGKLPCYLHADYFIGKLIEKFRKNCAFLNFFMQMLLIYNLHSVYDIVDVQCCPNSDIIFRCCCANCQTKPEKW
jgi:hypothetical protein